MKAAASLSITALKSANLRPLKFRSHSVAACETTDTLSMIATNPGLAKGDHMYVPKYAQRDESSLIHKFILEHPFATLMTYDREPYANHFPFLFEPNGNGGRLMSHMARSNGQWRQLEADPRALVVFQGAHSYISPSIYANSLNVPTWNYMAVHVYGRAKIIHDPDRIEKILQATVERFESNRDQPWKYDLPEEFRSKLVKAIVGFEIDIERVESKFKLSQNRAPEDYAAVVEEFLKRTDENGREMLAYMHLTKSQDV